MEPAQIHIEEEQRYPSIKEDRKAYTQQRFHKTYPHNNYKRPSRYLTTKILFESCMPIQIGEIKFSMISKLPSQNFDLKETIKSTTSLQRFL